MKRYFNLLVALLVVQLAVATWLFFSGSRPVDEVTGQPLLAIDVGEVDRLAIEAREQEIELDRVGDDWVLASMPALPVDGKRLDEVLANIAAVTTGWPVTTTAGARERFEVAPGNFQRRVRLYRGDELAGDFYLGTSPGFRQVHLRRDAEDAVYAVRLSVSDLPVSNDAWLDKSLLAATGLDRIESENYLLVKPEEGDWVLQGGADDEGLVVEAIDSERAEQLAAAFSGLRVQAIVTGPVPDGEEVETTAIQVRGAGGSYDYRFTAADSKYFVERADVEAVFTLSQYDYDRIAGVGRVDLLADQSTEEPDIPGESGQEEGEPEEE